MNPDSSLSSWPGVSVLIPFYNPGARLYDAVQSALQLQYPCFEIVLCNDGSTDASLDQIQPLIAEHQQKIQLISNPQRMGIPYTRNKLLNKARYHYVAWLDADDTVMPMRLALQMEQLQNYPNASICLGEALYVHNRRSHYKRIVKAPQLLKALMFYKQPFPFSSATCKTDHLKPMFCTEYRRAQDFDWLYKVLHNTELRVVHKPVVKVNILPDNQKPDIGSTQTILTQIQMKKLQDLGLHFSASDVQCLVVFLRNRRAMTSQQVRTALGIMKAVVAAWQDPQARDCMRAIYGYYRWLAVWSHGFRFFTFKPVADLKLVWQLIRARV